MHSHFCSITIPIYFRAHLKIPEYPFDQLIWNGGVVIIAPFLPDCYHIKVHIKGEGVTPHVLEGDTVLSEATRWWTIFVLDSTLVVQEAILIEFKIVFYLFIILISY